MEKSARRWPVEENGESIEEYMADWEQLAIKHGIGKVEEAIQELRVDPDQRFFPRPDEVAAKMRQIRLKNVPSHIYARG